MPDVENTQPTQPEQPHHYGPYNGIIIDDFRGHFPDPKNLPEEFDPLNLAKLSNEALLLMILTLKVYISQTPPSLPD